MCRVQREMVTLPCFSCEAVFVDTFLPLLKFMGCDLDCSPASKVKVEEDLRQRMRGKPDARLVQVCTNTR